MKKISGETFFYTTYLSLFQEISGELVALIYSDDVGAQRHQTEGEEKKEYYKLLIYV